MRPAASRDDGQAPALQLEGLLKRFGDTTAVDHVDLTVPRGSFFGLVGPNGAGKTTSLSMAVGLLRPDAGSARIFGVDVWADPVRAKRLIGVLPDGMALPERLTGRELLTYLGLLRGLDEATVARRAQQLLEVLELDEVERAVVIDYSAGMRKKITLAAPGLLAWRRASWSLLFAVAAAAALAATGVWALLDTSPAGVVAFPNNEADALLHFAFAVLYGAAAALHLWARRSQA
jgi:ABC-type uncharacterized transport system ATPase subunit